MLQMVRTLAQFSIALEEMNENVENTGDEVGGGERDAGEVEESADRDSNQSRNNSDGNGNCGGNLNGNGVCAGSPLFNGEVFCSHFHQNTFIFLSTVLHFCLLF